MKTHVNYLIFGGSGSLGKNLIKHLLKGTSSQIVVFSRDEAKHWTLKNEYAGTPEGSRLQFCIGDIRDPKRVLDAIMSYKPDKIIIAAAMKQVDTCELSPNESIQTNLVGTQNVIDAIKNIIRTTNYNEYFPHATLFVSTDKACSPVNVYGMCKAISERYVTSCAQEFIGEAKFIGVRYGNVLESRGSIIPLFRYQAEYNDAFTVTDPDMTRFLMTLDDSVDLIKHAFDNAKSGEIWIPRLKSMRIGDLAEIFSTKYKKPVKIIGLRPGEKIHEGLINSSESVRTRESGKTHYVIGPAYYAGQNEMFDYTSADDVMTKKELETYLKKLGIFDRSLSSFQGKSIEDIRTK